jgi:hypothetical protein
VDITTKAREAPYLLGCAIGNGFKILLLCLKYVVMEKRGLFAKLEEAKIERK